MSKTSTETIEPCPLCQERGIRMAAPGIKGPIYMISCSGCGLESTGHGHESDAVHEWNKFAAFHKMLEALTMALDYFIINREGSDPERDRIRPVVEAAINQAKGE